MKRLITWGGATVVGAVGAAAAFFLDPKSGARRRHAAVEKSSTIAPRARAQVSAMVAGASPSKGAKKKKPASRRKASPLEGDAVLIEAVRGALSGEHADVAAGVGVRVRSGRVTLRGEVPEIELIGRVARTIQDVDGVIEVNNLLRLERVS